MASVRVADRDRNHGIHIGSVAAVLGAFGLVIIVAALGVHALATAWGTPLAGTNAGGPPSHVAGPALESAPQDDRDRYVAEKARLLERYEWIDREQGIARIPIETAMALVAEAPARAGAGEGRRR